MNLQLELHFQVLLMVSSKRLVSWFQHVNPKIDKTNGTTKQRSQFLSNRRWLEGNPRTSHGGLVRWENHLFLWAMASMAMLNNQRVIIH